MTAPAMTADRALAALDDILTTGTGMLPDEVEGLREARAFFAAMVERTTWRPLETAPRNARILLKFSNGSVVAGIWEDDLYSPRPKPYWKHDKVRVRGMRATREFPPTEWMPIP